MEQKKIQESELILNPDGSIYHLKLKPENLADTIIVVGDPKRVQSVSGHFDQIEFTQENREIVTHTGHFKNKRLTVLSTGMGPDNIDIVMNELDALVNIDLEKRIPKETLTSLNIIRLGTSGALQADIDVDSFVASEYGLGIDGVLTFYRSAHVIEQDITSEFIRFSGWPKSLPEPYVVKGSASLLQKIGFDMTKGITATAGGFFGPQGRELRIPLAFPELNEKMEQFRFGGHRISNFEMETSALFGLGKLMGHEMLTVCVIVANRVSKQYSKDYKPALNDMIRLVLERLVA